MAKKKKAEIKFRGKTQAGVLVELEMVSEVKKVQDLKSKPIIKFFKDGKINPPPKHIVELGKTYWYSLKEKHPPTFTISVNEDLIKKYGFTKDEVEMLRTSLCVDEVTFLTEDEFDKRRFLWEV